MRNKGNFIVDEIEEYVVFDLETTGLSPEYDEIIEFSACYIKNNQIVARYETLIKPTQEIPKFIEDLTGISNDMVLGKPKIDEIIMDIYDFIKGKILLGHNIHFDLNFLYDAMKAYLDVELDNDYVDLLKVARKVFPEYKTHRLIYLARELKIKTKPTHRAMRDALATHEIYEICKKRAHEKNLAFSGLFQTKKIKTHDIRTNVISDEEPILDGEVFVFTGTLEKMNRKKAWELVLRKGGDIADNVSKKVNYLVLGNNDYQQRLKGGKSSKMKKAEDLILKGSNLHIISENVFSEMMNMNDDEKR